MTARRNALFVLSCFAAAACGGHVNLGAKPEPGAESDLPQPPTGSGIEVVAKLTTAIRVDMMVVADDFLYVGNYEGLSRCRKADCLSSLQLLPGVAAGISQVQLHDDSLGVVHTSVDEVWLARYSLPLGAEPQVVLRDLPPSTFAGSHWHEGFVYWGMFLDSSVYRCPLPTCDNGPERVGTYNNLGSIQADGELVLWNDESFIYRSRSFGAGPFQRLLPDDLLSEARTEPNADGPVSGSAGIESVAVGGGWLYASLASAPGCDDCGHTVMRWPLEGGAGRQVVTSPRRIDQMLVLGRELVWVPAAESRDLNVASELFRCNVDACEASRRKLGDVLSIPVVVTADDTDLYWLEAGPNLDPSSTSVLSNREIRRAPRLSPPP